MDKLLVYGFSEDNLSIIEDLAEKMNIELFEIDKRDINSEVGYYFGYDGYEKGALAKDGIDIEFFLFSDMDREKLYGLLRELANKGIKTPYKSVITKNNIKWKLSYLLDHIQSEYRTLMKFKKLGFLVKKAEEQLSVIKDEDLSNCIDNARSLQTKTDLTEEDVDDAISALERKIK